MKRVLFLIRMMINIVSNHSVYAYYTGENDRFTVLVFPGLSFSWKRALGITQAKQQISRRTGIPMTKAGLERKVGKAIIKTIFGR